MVSPGKVEIGQGIVTALAQIAADELDVDIARVQMVRASTAGSPNEGVTSGSLSVQHSGRAIRQACAEIRQMFLAAASDRLGVAPDVLAISDGTISGPGNVRPATGNSPTTSRSTVTRRRALCPNHRRSARWPEIPCSGWMLPTRCSGIRALFTIRALPGMLHGRVLRSELSAATLTALKEDGARAIAGLVAIMRDGNFAGVVSETEAGAEERSSRCARARHGRQAKRFPMKTSWRTG
jgi:nicotinate dehydrogenase subunit B